MVSEVNLVTFEILPFFDVFLTNLQQFDAQAQTHAEI